MTSLCSKSENIQKKQSVIVKKFFHEKLPMDKLHAGFDKNAAITSFCCCSKEFSEESVRNQDFLFFFSQSINFLSMLRRTHLKTFLEPWRYLCAEIQEFFAPKVKKIQKDHCNKINFFPKFGQTACCFWQDCRNSKFLLMFEKNFRRVRKKSGCFVFFIKYFSSECSPGHT